MSFWKHCVRDCFDKCYFTENVMSLLLSLPAVETTILVSVWKLEERQSGGADHECPHQLWSCWMRGIIYTSFGFLWLVSALESDLSDSFPWEAGWDIKTQAQLRKLAGERWTLSGKNVSLTAAFTPEIHVQKQASSPGWINNRGGFWILCLSWGRKTENKTAVVFPRTETELSAGLKEFRRWVPVFLVANNIRMQMKWLVRCLLSKSR